VGMIDGELVGWNDVVSVGIKLGEILEGIALDKRVGNSEDINWRLDGEKVVESRALDGIALASGICDCDVGG